MSGALLVCATVLAYLPSLRSGFIWNDSDYVTAPALRSLHGLLRIWTEPGVTQQYYPLLHSAFWVQFRLWGGNPLGYHIVTLLFHAASAVLFALVLLRLSGVGDLNEAGSRNDGDAIRPSPRRISASAAWFAALLFALHPVHVESVAWIAEQKNTLSLAFYLCAVLAYLRFDQTRRPAAYAKASVLFLLSLLCKTMTATLPGALLVVLWYRRGRLEWKRDIVPLVPWLGLGAGLGIFSGWVEKTYVGASGAGFDLPFAGRILVAGRSIWFYMGKLVWPFGVNFIYTRWKVDAGAWWQWLFPLGVVAVAAILWALRRRARGPLAAFLIFTGSLFPALGFVNLYGARYSWVWDHWQYLPDLGLLALAAGALAALQPVSLRFKWAVRGLLAALAVLLGALTWSHSEMFHDDQTLYLTALARNPGSWMAHNNLGLIWAATPGRMNDAVAQYQEALRLNPDFPEAHTNLGNAWLGTPGRLKDAVAESREALRLDPRYAEAHNNLGMALSKVPGRLDEAVAEFREAIRLRPNDAEAHNNLGLALSKTPGHLDEAVAEFNGALRLNPLDPEVHNNLGAILADMPGRLNDAVAEYREAVRLRPDYAGAHNNLGSALAVIPGRLQDAVAEYRDALRLGSNAAATHYNIGLALAAMPGRLNEAVAEFEEALRLNPDFPEAHYDLGNAWMRTPGKTEEALAHYQEAVRLRPDFAWAHYALGSALLRAERRTEAIAEYEKVLQLRPGDPSAIQMLDSIRASR